MTWLVSVGSLVRWLVVSSVVFQHPAKETLRWIAEVLGCGIVSIYLEIKTWSMSGLMG